MFLTFPFKKFLSVSSVKHRIFHLSSLSFKPNSPVSCRKTIKAIKKSLFTILAPVTLLFLIFPPVFRVFYLSFLVVAMFFLNSHWLLILLANHSALCAAHALLLPLLHKNNNNNNEGST